MAQNIVESGLVVMCHITLLIIATLFGGFSCLAVGEIQQGTGACPLWHVRWKDVCRCGDGLNGVVSCPEVAHVIDVQIGNCMTWSDETHSAIVGRCPFTYDFSDIVCPQQGYTGSNSIPFNVSGPDLSRLTCSKFNRQGTRCRECRGGYGPAPFSDGFSCADCSKHPHLWILDLLLQLSMVTIMYLVVILLQIKGTSCPLNIIITYCQLSVQIMISVRLHVKMVCLLGPTLTAIALTVIGISNLDFFRFVVPPLCIGPSFKSINVLLFDYIIAFYPIFLTLFIYMTIEFYDRNCYVVSCLAVPVKKFFSLFRQRWNPKTTILNTCITFILLAYSKLLCTSINLMLGVQSYDISGEVVPDSAVLFYDPTLRSFHSKHIPYAVLALSVIVIFVLLPPILLVLYPTRLFRACLNCCGFRRWDILHLVADVFQGWYKDGTEGSLDYRALSALYMLLRIIYGAGFLILEVYRHHYILGSYLVGTSHTFMGACLLIAQPYKKRWMNIIDGLTVLFIGMILLISLFDNKLIFLIGIVFIAVQVVVIGLCSVCKYVHTRVGHPQR